MNATPLENAIAAAGSKYRLAKLIGIKPPSVHDWLRTGRIPAERVIAVEAATGISRHKLRPDIYSDDQLPVVADPMYLPLVNGCIAIIDSSDYPALTQYRWHISSLGYPSTRVARNGKLVKEYLHRLILDVPPGHVVDHINNNLLDNRRANLRICTQQQNTFNQKGSCNNPSKFKGVSWKADIKKWRARIMVSRKEINLGVFDTPESAAAAYNSAAKRYFGEFAYLNPVETNQQVA